MTIPGVDLPSGTYLTPTLQPQTVLVGPGVALPKRVPPIKQDPYLRCTCGPSALEAVLRYWFPARASLVPSEHAVAELAAWDSYALQPRREMGAYIFWNDPRALAVAATQHGLYAKVEAATRIDQFRNQLAEWVAAGETVIVHRLLDGRSAAEGHYTVIDGIDTVGVHMMDPWPDNPQYVHVPWAAFLAQFKNNLVPTGIALRISSRPIL